MRVIVAGSRDIPSGLGYWLVDYAIEEAEPDHISEIVHGGANGIDQAAEGWANIHGIEVVEFPAKWDEHGKAAGPIRNTNMAKYGDMLVAIRKNESRGTTDMLKKARKRNLRIYLLDLNESRTYPPSPQKNL